METQTALQTFSAWIGIVGGLVGIVGGVAGVLTFVRDVVNDHDDVQPRVRPVDGGNGRPKAFVLEAVNLGRRPVCITYLGFVFAPFKEKGVHVTAIRHLAGTCCVDRFPYVLPPGEVCRIGIAPADLLDRRPVRPVVWLATQKRFLGAVIEAPDKYFYYNRMIDANLEDPLVEK